MKADAVICGAGIAGIAAAWHLSQRDGFDRIVLLERDAPLQLTSDKSTECFRNWWQGPGDDMVRFANRSIELLDDLSQRSANAFQLQYRGYLYLSADPLSIERLANIAAESEALGAGSFREHQSRASYEPSFDQGRRLHGADLLLDRGLIKHHFPYVTPQCVVALHVRRAGTLSAQQLGMLLLEQARDNGVTLLNGALQDIELVGDAVAGVVLATRDGIQRIATERVINAAGPYFADVSALVGVEPPVHCECHAKLTFADREGVFPRQAPLSIWCDETLLAWSNEERAELAQHGETAHLTRPFPAGVHGRPIGGGDTVTLYWTYDHRIEAPRYPLSVNPELTEILLRGMSVMVPGLHAYHTHLPAPYVDGGYYTKTKENRPLIGPTPVEGFYLIGALSGFGIMTAMAGGELLADHISGTSLPSYAQALAISRYDDPTYFGRFEQAGSSGQI